MFSDEQLEELSLDAWTDGVSAIKLDELIEEYKILRDDEGRRLVEAVLTTVKSEKIDVDFKALHNLMLVKKDGGTTNFPIFLCDKE